MFPWPQPNKQFLIYIMQDLRSIQQGVLGFILQYLYKDDLSAALQQSLAGKFG